MAKRERIVVRRVDNLGDIVIALPVIEALRSNYPSAHFTLMVKDVHRPLCRHLADDFIIPTTSDQFHRVARKYDIAYNIDYFGNDLKEQNRNSIVRHINGINWDKQQQVGQHLLLGLGVHGLRVPSKAIPRFPITSDLRARVDIWLERAGLKRDRTMWIGVHIGSREQKKCWPLEKYTKLCQWLVSTFDAQLLFFGTETEEPSIKTVCKSLPKGTTTPVISEPLDLVAGLLAQVDLVVGNDSGISHLAAAVRTPTVSIFESTNPVLWRPAGERSVIVLRPERLSSKSKQVIAPLQSIRQVQRGVLLAIQRYVRRQKYAVLDKIRVSNTIVIERTNAGTVVRSSTRGPACLVKYGWRRVKRILAVIEKERSYAITLQSVADADPLLDLFILHGIVRIGN